MNSPSASKVQKVPAILSGAHSPASSASSSSSGSCDPAQYRVWFNQGIAVADAAGAVRQADIASGARQLYVMLSQVDGRSTADRPASAAGDLSVAEPARSMPAQAYVDWCLSVCRANRVDLMVATYRRQAIERRRPEFEQAGTRLLAPGPASSMDLADSKDACSQFLSRHGVAVPAWRTASHVSELDEAYADLKARSPLVCVKPVRGVGGIGFHLFREPGMAPITGWMPANALIDYATFKRNWSSANKRPKLLVAEFLPGTERSIDCLAHNGQLVGSVCRAKVGSVQIIENTGPALASAARITQALGMTGLFNVQTKDALDGTPKLVEVNARMSDGTRYSIQAGTILPYWAVLLALGLADPQDIPRPIDGLELIPDASRIQNQTPNIIAALNFPRKDPS